MDFHLPSLSEVLRGLFESAVTWCTHVRFEPARPALCAPGGGRTHTVSVLSRLPLPLGVRGQRSLIFQRFLLACALHPALSRAPGGSKRRLPPLRKKAREYLDVLPGLCRPGRVDPGGITNASRRRS